MGGLWDEVVGGSRLRQWGAALTGGVVLAAVMGVQTGPSHSGEQLLCFFGREWDTSGGCVNLGITPAMGGP